MGEPITTSTNLITAVIGTGGLGSGLIAKILWDWLSNKQKKQSTTEYMTAAACARNQLHCPQIVQVKTDFIEHKTLVRAKLSEHNNLLHDINANVKQMSTRLNKFDMAITRIATKMESR